MPITSRHRRPLVAGTLSALGLLALALPALADTGATPEIRIPVERYRLGNGLEVLLHEDHATPIVFVNVTYHVGSGNETPGKSGFAHLFEHMMFQGSQHVGDDKHFAILTAIGGQGANGTTNTDRTNYFESVPANQLETALWLESDRMGYLLPVLNQKALDNQRDVVRNERRMNYENAAYAPERFAIGAGLYPEGHPYRYLTIGLHEDLERATLDDVRGFFEKWYVPANATLAIAGDIDVPATKALVEKWFGGFPRSVKPKVTPPPTPVLATKSRQVLEDKLATLRRIRYVWITPAAYQGADYELDLLALVMGSTTGRLRKALVVDRAIARNVGASQQGRNFSGEFHLTVDLAPNVNVEAAEVIINDEITKIRNQLVQPRELKQAVAAYVASYTYGLQTVASRGQQLQTYNHYVGDPDFVGQAIARYRKATPEDLRAAAQRYLTDKRLELITMPMPAGGAAAAAATATPGGR